MKSYDVSTADSLGGPYLLQQSIFQPPLADERFVSTATAEVSGRHPGVKSGEAYSPVLQLKKVCCKNERRVNVWS